MTRFLCMLTALSVLGGCAMFDRFTSRNANVSSFDEPVPSPVTKGEFPLGMGFRTKDDPCRFTGASELTQEHITRESNLVSCPIDYAGRGRFAIDSDAIERVRTSEYVVYTVPIP